MVRLVSLFKYYNYSEISIILQGIITMVRLVSLFKVLLFMKFYLVIVSLCVGLTHQYTGYITHVPAFCVYAEIYLIKQNSSFHSALRNAAFFKEYNDRMFFFLFCIFFILGLTTRKYIKNNPFFDKLCTMQVLDNIYPKLLKLFDISVTTIV